MKGMKILKAATARLLITLINEKIESLSNSIYSLNISTPVNYESIVRRHQKKIDELEKARLEIKHFLKIATKTTE